MLIVASLVFQLLLAPDANWQKHLPVLNRVERADSTFEYEVGIPTTQAYAAFGFLTQRYGLSRYPAIYRMPGSDLLLATVSVDSDTPGGFQFVLLRSTGAGFEAVSHTSSVGESWFLRPVFFTSEGRVIVLADFGEEYEYGFVVVECAKGQLHLLGQVDASSRDSSGYYGSPSEAALIRVQNGITSIEFPGNVILSPGAKGELVLPRNQRVLFQYDGTQVIRIK